MAGRIKATVMYNHPIAKVWEAITNKDALSEWLMECNLKLEMGNEFQFKTDPYPGFDGTVNCKVIELDPMQTFAYTWSGGNLKDTVVRFSLSEKGGQTELQFEHSGFEGFLNNLIAKNILGRGWKRKLLRTKLVNYLSK